jgi:hypothetical protein
MFLSRPRATKGKTSPAACVPGAPSPTLSALPPPPPPPPPPPCSCRHPRTAPTAATSPYHQPRPVLSGTRATRRRHCAPSPHPAVYASATTAAATPVAAFALLSNKPPPPARAPGFVHPQVRTLPPPPLLLPQSPADHASAAAAAPAVASFRRPSRYRPPPPTTLPGTCTTH